MIVELSNQNKAKRFYAKDRKSLRDWLEENHNISLGVWLVYDKQASGKRTLTYDDIVEEVVSFGWIDSLPRSLNDKQAMYYLSPRKPKSPWSKLNKERAEKLIREKKMTQGGFAVIERSKNDGSWSSYDAIENLTIPDDLKKALSHNKKAKENFANFSNSNKKQILWYIVSAKQAETREKRVKLIVTEAEKNNNPLEYRKNKKIN